VTAHRTYWTSREWKAVAAALSPAVRSPTPAQLDEAQRAALPPDRHRPKTVFAGRLNRAKIAQDLALARAREPGDLEMLNDRLAYLRRQLAAVDAQLAARPDLRPRFIQVHHAEPDDRLPPVIVAPEATDETPRVNRVDVVGLIKHQVTRVKQELELRDALRGVRFIGADERGVRDPAPNVVLVSGFIGHGIQAKYARSRRQFVTKPTTRRVVDAIVQLAKQEPTP